MPKQPDTEQRMARVEELLRASAAWEPERPAPEGLAMRALAAERERDEARQRRPAARRIAFWGFALGGLGAAGACASLALGLIGGPAPVPVTPAASLTAASPAAVETSAGRSATAAQRSETARGEDRAPIRQGRPAVLLAGMRSRVRSKRAGWRAEAPLRATWRERAVPAETPQLLEPGWLLRDDADGGLVATPGVIAVPVKTDACAPPGEARMNEEAPPPALSPEIGKPTEKTDHEE